MDYRIFNVRISQCVIILHAYSHRGPRFIVSSEGLLVVESAHNLFPEKSQGGRESPARKRTPIRFGDHPRSCLTLPFDSDVLSVAPALRH